MRILPTYQARDRIEQPARILRDVAFPLDQRYRRAHARESDIEHRQVAQFDADAAEPHGEPGRLALGQHQRRAGLRQPRAQPVDADFAQYRNGGNVERHLQRAAHAHRALEGEIEILRRVVSVAHRPVVDQSFGVQQPVLEGEAVNERFQGRAGRAQRLRHVHLAGAAFVEIIGISDAREHLAGLVIDREDGDGNLRTQRARPLQRQFLQGFLQRSVNGEPVQADFRFGRDHLVGDMRRQHRQRLAGVRHACGLGAGDFVARHDPGRRRTVEHAIPRRARGVWIAVGPAQFGRLRQRHQKRGLGQREFFRLLAEIGERRRAHAFKIAAVRRKRQIKRQEFAFCSTRVRARARASSGAVWRRDCGARAAPAGAPPAW